MAFGINKLRLPPPVPAHQGTNNPPGSVEFERKIDIISCTREVEGTKIDLLQNGKEFYPALLADIAAAREVIYFENYIIEDDHMGHALADALCERAKAGVKIALIYDVFGSKSTPHKFWTRLREAGILIRAFHPLTMFIRHHNRDHRKTALIDGRIGYTGGLCISDKWSTGDDPDGPWRDTAVRLEGPVVAGLRSGFAETWSEAHDPLQKKIKHMLPRMPVVDPDWRVPGGLPSRIIRSDSDRDSLELYHTYLLALQSCKKSAYLTNAYFVPDKHWRKTLCDTAARGVDIRLIVPAKIDERAVRYASHFYFTELLKGGVRIYEYQPVMIHAKTAVFDTIWSLVGSCNLDYQSLLYNFELNLAVRDEGFAQQMEKTYFADLELTREITLAEWEKRSTYERFMEKLCLLGRPEL